MRGESHLRETKKALQGQATSQMCNLCKEQFESKTKLFAHIHNMGHALASAENVKHNQAKKGKKGKR
jgi:DnaJ family protein A protein 5